MSNFDYVRPASLDEALLILSRQGAVPLAGGQSLLLAIRARLKSPSLLVDISRLVEIGQISIEGHQMRIGALVSHSRLGMDAIVQRALPGLAAAALGVADPAVRHRGTVGGSLAENHPEGDYPAVFLSLASRVVTSERELGLEEFLRSPRQTALRQGELILSVVFPLPERFAYAKFPHPASKYALAGVAVTAGADGTRVAVAGTSPNGAFLWPEAAAALGRSFDLAGLRALRFEAVSRLRNDHQGSSAYRAQLISVMAVRAAEMALDGLGKR